jgi:hypothetical protein
MSNGRATLKKIDAQLAALRKEHDGVEAELARAGSEFARLQEQEIGAFRELAEFRLGEANMARLSGALDRADAELKRLKSAREATLSGLDRELQSARSDVERLETRRDELSGKIAELRGKIGSADSALLADLAEDAAYKAHLAAVEAAERTAAEAERKAELAKQDRTEKGKPYEADPLFMYLWQRKFGTSDYQSTGLVKMLDQWVARLVGYQDARPNYHMLVELPERLGEHAERARKAAQDAAEKLEAFETEHRRAAGILSMDETADASEGELGTLAAQLNERIAARTALEARRAAIMRGDDEESRSAIDSLAAVLRDTRLADLHKAALLTPDPADERIVARIDDLREKIEDREHDLDRLRRIERDLEKKLAEFQEVRSRFVNERLDDDRWNFDDAMVEDILKGLVRGAITAAVVWTELRRRGSYTPGPTRPTSDTWGKMPSGPIFRPRSGGLGRSGGFGGGGFRTGGTFGSRGGFRTGGKF